MTTVDEAANARFTEDGYVILQGLLKPARDLSPMQLEYESLLCAVSTRLQGDGVVASTHAALPFGQRFCALLSEKWAGRL